jgi:hypothetical protein
VRAETAYSTLLIDVRQVMAIPVEECGEPLIAIPPGLLIDRSDANVALRHQG